MLAANVLFPGRVRKARDDPGPSIAYPKVFIKKEQSTYLLVPGSARAYGALGRETER